MSILVEGRRGFHLGGSARIVEDSRELAWAEAHVVKTPDIKWILGNYVQAATPEVATYNTNGHSFPYEDLKDAIKTIPHRPLNLLHIPNRRVGTFTAAEFVWPEGEKAGESEPPIVEALAAYWCYYEAELLASIEMAHRDGGLFFSMEAVPASITCHGQLEIAGCNETFNYEGPKSPTYCDHLNLPRSRKVLNKPVFKGGALIIPPSRPGWKNANVKEMSRIIEDNIERAELVYDQVSEEFPHLNAASWERLMAWFLMATEDN